jgi:1-aminocyclopropane-1-carboxylate deaminase
MVFKRCIKFYLNQIKKKILVNLEMFQLTTPIIIEELNDSFLDRFGLKLYVQREDLAFSEVPGNKWRKLKYNLMQAKEEGYHTLLTFGGAYSNHIAATAAAGKMYGFKTIGLIRGEAYDRLNPTLSKASDDGMLLHYLARDVYRNKMDPVYIQELHDLYGAFYLLPEGGSNSLAVKGCAEMIVSESIQYDFLCCPVGTGATLAGMIAGSRGRKKVLGFSSLKGGAFLNNDVLSFLESFRVAQGLAVYENWEIIQKYHFGGYAKTNQVLLDFIRAFNERNQIPLDCIYTGKMFFGLYDMIEKGFFAKGDTVLAIHTGGLQGNSGFR